ncbi:MAG TPA: hypothetical protein P5307_07020 [Pirellulaceae bacterium]|nr:hypothetical protein [Pirellulaceae bacterium]
MLRSIRYLAFAASLGTLGIAAFVGCSPSTTTHPMASTSDPTSVQTAPVSPASSLSAAKEPADEHPHIPGAHGGIVIPIGSDSYHAEAVIEKDGVFRLLMLGADETRIQEVDLQAVKAYIKAAGETDATPIDMQATPQDGDAPDKTSQFVGRLPETAIGRAIDVTIPNLKIGAERFRVGFTTAVEVHDSGMPAAVTGDEEQKLYFTAGGKYSEVDIKANGPLSAGAKFRGFMSKHDMSPKPGDLICPVTFTKANPKIEWQVNGKKYLFCCPPCVDEFVRMAKEEPESLLEPEEYVQKDKMGRGGVGSEGVGSKKEEMTAVASTPSTSTPTSQLDPEIAEALAGLDSDDRKLADAQKFCAVMTDNLLGSMGTPVKVDVNGETVFLCCDGCKGKALRQADETLANVAKLKANQAAHSK